MKGMIRRWKLIDGFFREEYIYMYIYIYIFFIIINIIWLIKR